MADRPTTRCWTCNGDGWVVTKITQNYRLHDRCPTCRGHGEVPLGLTAGGDRDGTT